MRGLFLCVLNRFLDSGRATESDIPTLVREMQYPSCRSIKLQSPIGRQLSGVTATAWETCVSSRETRNGLAMKALGNQQYWSRAPSV
jgi:hypothetical protein